MILRLISARARLELCRRGAREIQVAGAVSRHGPDGDIPGGIDYGIFRRCDVAYAYEQRHHVPHAVTPSTCHAMFLVLILLWVRPDWMIRRQRQATHRCVA